MTDRSLLLRNVATGTGSGLDVRLNSGLIEEIGVGLARRRGEAVVDGAGGAVIAGLHDQHVHLRAAVAARQSADLSGAGDPAGLDRMIATAAAAVRPGGWLRATAWNEHAGGPLDRRRLDALTGQVPARVQHRSGAMWVLNSAALRAVGADGCELTGIERDSDGEPTGRLLRMDAWLRDQLTAGQRDRDNRGFAAGLAALADWHASRGVTGLTDATPDRDQRDADELAGLSADGIFSQRLVLMAPPGLRPAAAPLVSAGPVKIVLDDQLMPTAGDLAATITHAHRHGSRVAVHCVTADQLVVAVAAAELAGPPPPGTAGPDRIEHASVVPPGYPSRLAALGLAVVTQPSFIAARGDDYIGHVAGAERHWLYPCASLDATGVPVAAGTDAPFGPADPWLAIAAAVSRRTAGGAVLGRAERVSPVRALRLWQTAADDVRQIRAVRPGQPADLCVLTEPLPQALAAPGSASVRATIVAGRVVWPQA